MRALTQASYCRLTSLCNDFFVAFLISFHFQCLFFIIIVEENQRNEKKKKKKKKKKKSKLLQSSKKLVS